MSNLGAETERSDFFKSSEDVLRLHVIVFEDATKTKLKNNVCHNVVYPYYTVHFKTFVQNKNVPNWLSAWVIFLLQSNLP